MKEIDFERAALLMDIQSKVANVGVMNQSIAGEAAEELKAITEDCRQNGLERADRIRQEEQVAEKRRLEAIEFNMEPINPDPKPQPIAQYMPGEPDPNIRSEDVRTQHSEDETKSTLVDRRV